MAYEGIEFDYSRAMLQANRLEEIAANIMNMSDRELENALQELRYGWEGDASQLYIQKGMELKTKIDSISKNLVDAAQTIRRIARRLHDAEMAAVSILQSNS